MNPVMAESMGNSEPEPRKWTENERQFLAAFVWEVGHLEKDGPVHRLIAEHGLTELDVQIIGATAKIRMPDEIFGEDRIQHNGWPWPGKTRDEIIG